MEHEIITYGGGEIFFYIFNGIAALMKTNGVIVNDLTRLILAAGAIWALTQSLFKNELYSQVQWFIWVLAVTTLLTVPKTTVFIYDPIRNEKLKVDDVPWALGVMAATTSSIGKSITEKMEQAFTEPSGLDRNTYQPYHKTGTVFASALMSQVGKFRIVDPDFNANMERFVNQCVVQTAMIGHKYTLKELHKSDNIWKLVSENASPVLGFLYKEGRGSGSIVTCRVGAQKLQSLWKEQINEAINIYGGRIQDVPMTDEEFKTRLSKSYSFLSNATQIAGSAENLLRQEMMISAIEQGSNNKNSELNPSSNYATAKALAQHRSQGKTTSQLAALTLPVMKTIIEAVAYAMFLFVAVLALLPAGWKILRRYVEILIWTQLWPPLYAVLNLIMSVSARNSTADYLGSNGLSILNSSAIYNLNENIVAEAGLATILIPFMSTLILVGGSAAFSGFSQSIGASLQSSAGGVAAETVSGNVSLSNVSVGTQAFNNKTGFQVNTSPSYDASQFRHMDTSGTQVTTHGSGHQSVHDQGMSQMASEFWVEHNTSLSQQQAYEESQRNTEQLSIQANKAMSQAADVTRSALMQADKTFSTSEDYSSQLSGTQNKTIHEAMEAATAVNSGNNFAGEKAMGGHAGAGVGGNVGVANASVGGDLSVRASHGYEMSAARNASLHQNSGASMEKGLQEVIHQAEATGNTDLANTAKSALFSLHQAQDLSQQYQASLEKTQQLSNSLSFSQSQSSTQRKNVGQEYLEYVQDQTGLTAQQAMRLIDGGGEPHRQYYAAFLGEHREYSPIQPDFSQKEQQMQGNFAHNNGTAEALAQQGFGQIGTKGMAEVNSIERENDLALKGHIPDESTFSQRIRSSIDNTHVQVEAHTQKIAQKAKDLSEKVSAQQKNYLVGDIGRLMVGEEPNMAVPTFNNSESTSAPHSHYPSQSEEPDYGLFKGAAPREAFESNPIPVQAQVPEDRLFANGNSGPQDLKDGESSQTKSTSHLEDNFPTTGSQRRS